MTTLLMTSDTMTLPAGYTVRPTSLDDAPLVADLFNKTSAARGDNETTSVDLLLIDWQEPKFDLARSSRVVFAPDNTLVGIITIFDNSEKPVTIYTTWDVLPDVPERAAIGHALLTWGEARAREAIDRCPPDARVVMKAGTLSGYTPDESVMTAFGMTPCRFFNRMLINMTEPVAPVELPAGYSLTTHAQRQNLRELVVAKNDAWRDHFGYVETEISEILADWEHWVSTDKHNLYDMWYLAIDDATDEIAGMVLCRNEEWDNPACGYVCIVAVRRPYRKQGLAEALLRITFADFWKRGRKDVSLGVDGSSPTGATRLYERVGMHISRTFTQYEKELRAGVDLVFKG